MDKLKMRTPSKVDENIAKIGALFPNILTEKINEKGEVERAIDFDMLKQELSSVVVEGNEERYQFTWPDKKKSVLLANVPIAETLRPCREESMDFDSTENLYIEGDNLNVLKLLQETYLGKVKMIYIDPPYNTGSDFVYADDYAQDTDEYLANSGQFDAEGNRLVKNLDSNGRFHTDWLNMLYPRLRLAKDLLRNDGLIFISIDDNEVRNLRIICDTVYGEQNYIAQLTLLTNPKGRSQDKYFATCHEYVLIYSKSALGKGALSISKENADIESDYQLEDENGVYRLLELRNTHREFGKHNRPNLYYPFFIGDNGDLAIVPTTQHTVSIYPNWNDGFEGCWTWGIQKALDNIKLLVARKVNDEWKIYRKAYAFQNGEVAKKQLKSIWIDKIFHTEKGQKTFNELFDTKEKIFQSPKSVELIMQMIKIAAGEEEIVLDFFSGSATTAHAIMQLNSEDNGKRKYIMVQLPEVTDKNSEAFKTGYKNICEIGKERIRRAGKKIEEESPLTTQNLDIGFRVLKLDSTNMKDVYYNPTEYEATLFDSLTDNIKEDRTPEDLLFQVMLDLGVLLSSKIEQSVIGGKKVFNVADNFLIACFDDKITEEAVKAIAQKKPYYAVFRDSSYASDSVATNFEQIFATYSADTVRRVL